MKISLNRFTIAKRHALAISRGTATGSENLLVRIEHEGIEGLGEMAPTSGGALSETAESAESALQAHLPKLEACAPYEMQRIENLCAEGTEGSAWKTALDIALYDWLGRRAGLPLWRLFGLDRDRIPKTSITLGINSPERVREILPEMLTRIEAQILKVKLGSPAGIEADKAMFVAAQESATRPLGWRVDANGGWNLEQAQKMTVWLAERGVGFVEQPLPRGAESDLASLRAISPLPLYLDESLYSAADIPRFAPFCDGVNIKLMKCGGLREAWRLIHTAQAHGLKVMFGCMSETALAITAAAHLSPVATEVDLDSHLNLRDDPFLGASLQEGRILPNDLPGLGVTWRTGEAQ